MYPEYVFPETGHTRITQQHGTNSAVLHIKQGGQCAYNVTRGAVRVTTVTVGEEQVLHILSVSL